MDLSPAAQAFLRVPATRAPAAGIEYSWRAFGAGDPVLLLHGWPLTGFTWRAVLPALAARHTCYALDSAGLGETAWPESHDFSFTGQARTTLAWLDAAGIGPIRILAQDTGATIARAMALLAPDRIRSMVLVGTEIPFHRPPWIQTYQLTTRLPGAELSFRLLMRIPAWVRSSLAFGECFLDKGLIEGEFYDLMLKPLADSPARIHGAARYLQGIDFPFIDSLATRHKEIGCPVLLVHGREDSIFPVADARGMVPQLGDCRGLVEVAGAKLLVHEERAGEVAELALSHFSTR